MVFWDGFGLADEQPLVTSWAKWLTHPLQDKHRESIGIQLNFQQSLANCLGYGGLKLYLYIILYHICSVHVRPTSFCAASISTRSAKVIPVRAWPSCSFSRSPGFLVLGTLGPLESLESLESTEGIFSAGAEMEILGMATVTSSEATSSSSPGIYFWGRTWTCNMEIWSGEFQMGQMSANQ